MFKKWFVSRTQNQSSAQSRIPNCPGLEQKFSTVHYMMHLVLRKYHAESKKHEDVIDSSIVLPQFDWVCMVPSELCVNSSLPASERVTLCEKFVWVENRRTRAEKMKSNVIKQVIGWKNRFSKRRPWKCEGEKTACAELETSEITRPYCNTKRSWKQRLNLCNIQFACGRLQRGR